MDSRLKYCVLIAITTILNKKKDVNLELKKIYELSGENEIDNNIKELFKHEFKHEIIEDDIIDFFSPSNKLTEEDIEFYEKLKLNYEEFPEPFENNVKINDEFLKQKSIEFSTSLDIGWEPIELKDIIDLLSKAFKKSIGDNLTIQELQTKALEEYDLCIIIYNLYKTNDFITQYDPNTIETDIPLIEAIKQKTDDYEFKNLMDLSIFNRKKLEINIPYDGKNYKFPLTKKKLDFDNICDNLIIELEKVPKYFMVLIPCGFNKEVDSYCFLVKKQRLSFEINRLLEEREDPILFKRIDEIPNWTFFILFIKNYNKIFSTEILEEFKIKYKENIMAFEKSDIFKDTLENNYYLKDLHLTCNEILLRDHFNVLHVNTKSSIYKKRKQFLGVIK